MHFRVLLIIVCLWLASCSGPLDRKYTAANYVNDIASIRESEKLSSEDLDLLTSYITLAHVAGNGLEGQTYSDILDKIRAVRDAGKEESGRVEMEKEYARQRMGALLSVSLGGKEYIAEKTREVLSYTLSINNLADKNIKMVVGSISINDLLDREIKNIPIVLEETIHPHAPVQKVYTFPYEPGNEHDLQIRTKELVDLRVVWNPVKIIFEDGTKAE